MDLFRTISARNCKQPRERPVRADVLDGCGQRRRLLVLLYWLYVVLYRLGKFPFSSKLVSDRSYSSFPLSLTRTPFIRPFPRTNLRLCVGSRVYRTDRFCNTNGAGIVEPLGSILGLRWLVGSSEMASRTSVSRSFVREDDVCLFVCLLLALLSRSTNIHTRDCLTLTAQYTSVFRRSTFGLMMLSQAFDHQGSATSLQVLVRSRSDPQGSRLFRYFFDALMTIRGD